MVNSSFDMLKRGLRRIPICILIVHIIRSSLDWSMFNQARRLGLISVRSLWDGALQIRRQVQNQDIEWLKWNAWYGRREGHRGFPDVRLRKRWDKERDYRTMPQQSHALPAAYACIFSSHCHTDSKPAERCSHSGVSFIERLRRDS